MRRRRSDRRDHLAGHRRLRGITDVLPMMIAEAEMLGCRRMAEPENWAPRSGSHAIAAPPFSVNARFGRSRIGPNPAKPLPAHPCLISGRMWMATRETILVDGNEAA